MPEFMLSLRAACLKLRKEEKTVLAGAVKRITLGRSTRFDNNNNNMLDLALNCVSHWDDWVRLLPAQEIGRQGESCLNSCEENARKFSHDLPLPACYGIIMKLLER